MRCHIIAALLAVLLTISARAQDSLRFGPVRVGDTQTDTLRFSNTMLVDLMVDGVTLQSSVFDVKGAPFSGALSRLNPGEERGIPIAFSPTEETPFSATVAIQTDQGIYDRLLTGEGVREVVVINEILADPPSGSAGDANGDGTRSSSEDEFVELLNIGNYPVNIAGWQLSDANTSTAKRFAFPEGTWIESGGYVVLFGGGADMPSGHFADDGKIGGGLSNSGDGVFLFDPSGQDTLARAIYGKEGGKDRALVRIPDGAVEWGAHTDFPGTGDRFSPGRPRDIFTTLSIEPNITSMAVGDTVRLQVVAHSAEGISLEMTDEVLWVVTPSGSLEDLGEGLWVGRVAGEVVIRAHLDPLVSSDLALQIEGEGLSGLRVTPADTALLVGDGLEISCAGLMPDGEEIALENYDIEIPDAGVLDLVGGMLTALSPGQIDLVVSLDDLSASATVRVVQYGDLDADGAVGLVDAVRTVHLIAQKPPPATDFEMRASDLDSNGLIDIRDVVLIVGKMLEQAGHSKPALARPGHWFRDENRLVAHFRESVQLILVQSISANHPVVDDGHSICLSRNDGAVNMTLVMGESGVGIADEHAPLSLDFGSGELEVQRIVGISSEGLPFVLMSELTDQGSGLSQVCPNPFNPTVALAYVLGDNQAVTLSIFNPQGQELIRLIDESQTVGTHTVVWNGRDVFGNAVASGIYLARLRGENFSSTKKLVLVK